MGDWELPGYDAWKLASPPSGQDASDYERGVERLAPDVPDTCERLHAGCDEAEWDGDGAFTGCLLGVTDTSFTVTGDARECVEMQKAAREWDEAAYRRDEEADRDLY